MRVSDSSVLFLRNTLRPSSLWEADSLLADQDMVPRFVKQKLIFVFKGNHRISLYWAREAIPYSYAVIIQGVS